MNRGVLLQNIWTSLRIFAKRDEGTLLKAFRLMWIKLGQIFAAHRFFGHLRVGGTVRDALGNLLTKISSRFRSAQKPAQRKTKGAPRNSKNKPETGRKTLSRRIGQITIIAMEVLAIIFTIIVAGLGGVAWRVSQAPLPLPWVVAAMSEQFSDAKTGRNFHLDAAILSYDDERQMVTLDLRGLSFHDTNSTLSVSFPEAKIRFGLFGFLLGNIFPRVIVASDSELTIGDPLALREALAVKPDTPLSATQDQDDKKIFNFSPQALFSQAFLLTLQRIELRDVRLRIGRHAEGDLTRAPPDIITPIIVPEISLVLRHEISDYLPSNTQQEAVASDAGRIIIRGVKPDYIGRFWPEYPFLAAIDMPMDFEFGYILDHGFAESGRGGITIKARMRGVAGRIKWEQFKDKFLDIESLDARITWRSVPNVTNTAPSSSFFKKIKKNDKVDNQLTVDKLILVTPDAGPILNVKLDVLSHAPVSPGAPRVSDLVADLSINKLNMAQLDRYWPPLFAKETRDWVVTNIHQANLSNLGFHLELKHRMSKAVTPNNQAQIQKNLHQIDGSARRSENAISAERGTDAAPSLLDEEVKIVAANGKFDYKNMTINYVDGLPYITELFGKARFDAERFDFSVEGGKCANLALGSGGAVSFTGLDAPITMLSIFLNLSGGKGDFGGNINAGSSLFGKGNAPNASRSGLSTALHILDSKPLALLSDTPLSEKLDRGAAEIQLALSMPLLENIPDDQIKFTASADLEDVELVNILNGWSVTQARAHIEANNDKLTLTGEGLFENIPTKIQWDEYFKPNAANRRVVHAEARLDAANAAHLKIPLYGKLSNEMPISLDFTEDQFSNGKLTAHFDATPAEYVMNFPYAVKNAGDVAQGDVALLLKNGQILGLSQAKIIGPKIDIDIVGEFNANGTQTGLDFNQFRFGENDFTGTIKFVSENAVELERDEPGDKRDENIKLTPRNDDQKTGQKTDQKTGQKTGQKKPEHLNGHIIQLRGQMIDLSRLLMESSASAARAKSVPQSPANSGGVKENELATPSVAKTPPQTAALPSQSDSEPAFDADLLAFPHMTRLDLAFDQIKMAHQKNFQSVTFSGLFQKDMWQKIDLTAKLDAQSWLDLHLSPVEDHRDLTVSSNNAGLILAGLGVSETLMGGKIDIKGRLENDRLESNYHIEMKNYRLVKAPVMARILAVVSITSIPDLMAGEGIVFQDFSAELRRVSKGWEIKSLLARGTSLGLSLQGIILGHEHELKLEGTVVPLYGISKLVGAIPVVGQILTGGAAGGIFAWSFYIQGRPDQPVVAVNPLSALTPGILRSLIEKMLPQQKFDETAPIATPLNSPPLGTKPQKNPVPLPQPNAPQPNAPQPAIPNSAPVLPLPSLPNLNPPGLQMETSPKPTPEVPSSTPPESSSGLSNERPAGGGESPPVVSPPMNGLK